MKTTVCTGLTSAAAERADILFRKYETDQRHMTDRMFAALMIFQWIAEISLALWISPKTWTGRMSQTHPHVWTALILGGAICS
ncbi:MAG TPA: hypothetical protein VGH74_22810, partial [Planctomycetaceae bacterium]